MIYRPRVSATLHGDFGHDLVSYIMECGIAKHITDFGLDGETSLRENDDGEFDYQ